MGIATFPATTSPIKSIQRGTATVAGNITISAVDTAKTTLRSFSTGSAGSVAATGTISAANGSTSSVSTSTHSGYAAGYQAGSGSSANVAVGNTTAYSPRYGSFSTTVNVAALASNQTMNMNAMNINGANVALNSQSISGGSTSLTSASYGVYLVDSTTIYATGPCRYEVVEYY